MIVLTQLMRLHQITCGHFAADDGTIQAIKNNRLSELLDVLEEIDGKQNSKMWKINNLKF